MVVVVSVVVWCGGVCVEWNKECWRAGGAQLPPQHCGPTQAPQRAPPCCLQMLQALGARVDGPLPAQFNGLTELELWPRVTWSPLFACCWDDLEEKVAAASVHVGSDTALVIEAPQARIRSLDLRRGVLVIRGSGGAAAAAAAGGEAAAEAAGGAAAGEREVVVEDVTVDNEGWEWRALSPDEGAAEEEYIRGFRVVRKGQMELP